MMQIKPKEIPHSFWVNVDQDQAEGGVPEDSAGKKVGQGPVSPFWQMRRKMTATGQHARAQS